jgi:hypothetical protein
VNGPYEKVSIAENEKEKRCQDGGEKKKGRGERYGDYDDMPRWSPAMDPAGVLKK